ncbi:hypothetical protein ACE1TF_13855 [Geomicrobium sp. JSM 1781026]|uniref:hypothetical protein n=1 Tax=Geomicrobium sp. JSM 1781026 TaxID=3344580 RepID=UPI0035BF0B90
MLELIHSKYKERYSLWSTFFKKTKVYFWLSLIAVIACATLLAYYIRYDHLASGVLALSLLLLYLITIPKMAKRVRKQNYYVRSKKGYIVKQKNDFKQDLSTLGLDSIDQLSQFLRILENEIKKLQPLPIFKWNSMKSILLPLYVALLASLLNPTANMYHSFLMAVTLAASILFAYISYSLFAKVTSTFFRPTLTSYENMHYEISGILEELTLETIIKQESSAEITQKMSDTDD